MTSEAGTQVSHRSFWTRYPHLCRNVFGLLITLLVMPAFFVPAGAAANYGRDGAVVGGLLGAFCSVNFLRCPCRPLLAKFITLVLAIPALYFGVDAISRCFVILQDR